MKPAKRQCFSVESLAVSSQKERDIPSNDRNTDSPYVHYSHLKQDSEVNNNTNVMPFVFNHPYYNVNAFRQYEQSFDMTRISHQQNMMFPNISTSTPITVSSKRRRICSGSSGTSPTSSEDERLVADISVTSESVEDEKMSISSSTSSSVTSDPDLDHYQDDSLSKRKKARTAFTAEQLRTLEKRYKTHKYMSASDRTHLARSLKLTDQQVKTWFQNRRMKEKRQQKDEERSNGFSLPTGGVDIAQLAALGICPPPYGLNATTATSYSNNVNPNTDPSISPQPKPESRSPVYKYPTIHPALKAPNSLYADRLAALMQHSPLISQQMPLAPSGTQHPLLHYGYSSQFSPLMQMGKLS